MPLKTPDIVNLDQETHAWTMGRAGLMELLYKAYGRDNPEHPQHSLYTGLMEQASRDIGRFVLEDAAARWEEKGDILTIPVRFER